MAIVISGTTGIDLTGLPINNSGNAEVDGVLINGAVPIALQSLAQAVIHQPLVGNVNLALTNKTNDAYTYIYNDGNALNIANSYNNTAGYKPIVFTIGGAERMRIDSAGNVGIGISSPEKNLSINGASGISLMNTSFTGRRWNFKNEGSLYIGHYVSDPNIVTNSVTIDQDGNVLLTSGTGRLGYGAGAGGTVTQLTSKGTAVTLNKPSGQITMNNAVLAAGASVGFILNNDLILGNQDLLVITTGGASSYDISYSCGTGIAFILVKNKSAGSLSEAIILNFTVIKGAIA